MTITPTSDELALLAQMRAWKDGIPDLAVSQRPESAVYVHLVAARAELYRKALLHGDNDLMRRHDAFKNLLSPGLLIELCKAWLDLRAREREDEAREMEDASI